MLVMSCAHCIVIEAQEAADIHQSIFFGGHGASIPIAEQFPRNLQHRHVGITRALAL